MIDRPQFAPHVRAEIVRGEGVFLISEAGHSVVNGRLFESVVPLIDGCRSTEELVECLRSDTSPAEVYYALNWLEERGFLVEYDGNLPLGEAALWTLQGIDPSTAAKRLAETGVTLTAFGNISDEPLRALLKSLHVRVSKEGGLGIVLTDDYLRGDVQEYNRNALVEGRSWIVVKPVGCEVWIGPVFTPGRTACWECLAQRLRLNRGIETFIQRKQNRADSIRVPEAATPVTQQIACSIAASEIAKWIALGQISYLEDRLLSLNVLSWQSQCHSLVRQPHCPECGKAASRALSVPVVLERSNTTLNKETGYRSVAAEETIRKYERHISPISGAVKVLERRVVPGGGVVHVYTAGQNFAAPVRSIKHMQKSLRSRSSGKGITEAQARASGLCEALERYSGVFQGNEIRRTATLRELGGMGIHPNNCMGFSSKQYSERATINARGSRFNFVPLPFDEDVELDWTPIWSLTHHTHRYLPTEYCYYDYPAAEHQKQCISCSNGCAAGNTLEEALLQGFLELVERDSVALWWYNRVVRPAVDLAGFDEPFVSNVRAFLQQRHRDLWVLDLTSDLDIPVFAALSRRTDQAQERIMIGFGSHLDASVALLRAVAELNQMLAWVLPGEDATNDTPEVLEDSDAMKWLNTATITNQPYLAPNMAGFPRTPRAYPQYSTNDLRSDVLFCQDLVERHGMEMLVLDQTRPDIGLPVVKVVVPGLRHFWARFAPGRLYEAPLALGWLDSPLAEDQLNPIPMFL